MRKGFFHSSATLCSLVLLFAAVDLRPCGQGSGSSSIVDLPSLGGSDLQVHALNAAGQLTGFSYISGDLGAHAFLYSAGTLTDLGTLGGNVSQGFAINSTGQIVGQSNLGDSSETHAFLYSGGALLDLGTLGGSSSGAIGINDAGQIVGNSLLAGDASQQAFLYANGQMTGLGDLGGNYSFAAAINQSGTIVGDSFTSDFEDHAFLYANGTMADLGTLGGGYSAAFALNDGGTIIGESSLQDGSTHAFIYSASSMTDLGTLGGTYSSPVAINNAGQVIGYATTSNDAQFLGFIYGAGTLADLGTLGGTYTDPAAINNLGQVVGDSGLADGSPHAFLWQNGTMLDLNTLLPPNSNWELLTARLINDAGRIVGVGFHNGVYGWFVMDLASANNPPVANAGQDQTVQCPSLVTLDGSHSTDPDGDTLSFQWSEGASILGANAVQTVSLPLGTHTITLTVTDPCGASSSTNVVVNVIDTTAPTVACPAAVTVSADSNCHALVPNLISQVLASDNCAAAGTLTVSQNPAAGTSVGLGQHSISFTIADPSGNTATCSTALNVVDNIAPVIISGPAIAPISANANCQGAVPAVTSEIVASDNCTPANVLIISQQPAAGTLVGIGQHTIVVTVTDGSGNHTSGTLSLSVVDTTAPSILSVPASLTVSASAACQAAVPNVVPEIVAADNCTPANALVITQEPAAGTLVGLGPHTIVVTVTDSAGNHTSGTISFSVIDTTAPSILSAPASLTISVSAACQAAVPSVLPEIVATDNCTPANALTITQNPAAGTLVGIGPHTITVSVTDAAGNRASRGISLLVTDQVAPVINSLSVSPSVLSQPNHDIVPVTVSVSASDNCDPAPLSKIVSITSSEPADPGDIQITGDLTANLVATRNPSGDGRIYTITVQCADISGNASVGTVTVTVPKGNGNGGGKRP